MLICYLSLDSWSKSQDSRKFQHPEAFCVSCLLKPYALESLGKHVGIGPPASGSRGGASDCVTRATFSLPRLGCSLSLEFPLASLWFSQIPSLPFVAHSAHGWLAWASVSTAGGINCVLPCAPAACHIHLGASTAVQELAFPGRA